MTENLRTAVIPHFGHNGEPVVQISSVVGLAFENVLDQFGDQLRVDSAVQAANVQQLGDVENVVLIDDLPENVRRDEVGLKAIIN